MRALRADRCAAPGPEADIRPAPAVGCGRPRRRAAVPSRPDVPRWTPVRSRQIWRHWDAARCRRGGRLSQPRFTAR